MKSGIILIDKPTGIGSTDVVRAIKRITGAKTGHLGTLDPMATGVLPIAIGKATRLFDIFLTKRKGYVVEFTFGSITDTLDITGNILNTSEHRPKYEQVKNAIDSMIGEFEQMPPDYSAKKINGVPAYKLARQNKQVVLKPKLINIYKFDLLTFCDDKMTAYIECSAGTYIRAVGRDLAEKLDTFISMSALRRTKAGIFLIDNCVNKIDDNKNNNSVNYNEIDFEIISKNIISIENALKEYIFLDVDDDQFFRLKNGQTIVINEIKTLKNNIFVIKYQAKVLGLAEKNEYGLKMKTFLAEDNDF